MTSELPADGSPTPKDETGPEACRETIPHTQPPPGRWLYESIAPNLVQAQRVERVLHSSKTPYQEIMVVDSACFGRALALDGRIQSTEADEFVYHEALVHPAMIAHPGPGSVFIAGGGEGATAREALSHQTVDRVVMVDLDEEVVDVCRKFLPNHHRGAFDDHRLELHHQDAFEYLAAADRRFDVALIDVPDPIEGGPAHRLYTREFYALVRRRLTDDGMIAVHAGPTGPTLHSLCFSAVVNTIADVFPVVRAAEAFVPAFGSMWGFALGSLGPDPLSMTPDEIDRRLARRLRTDLRFYDGPAHLGMFSLPKYLRRALEAETRVVTRRNPLFVV